MEIEEKRWRQAEIVLRRLVGRLCAAGMGVDPQLDDELAKLAAANRRNADTAELESLAASLTQTVAVVDEHSPVLAYAPKPAGPAFGPPPSSAPAPRPERWQLTCTAVGTLLEYLQQSDPAHLGVQQLIADVSRVTTDTDLADLVERAADLLRERSQTIAAERMQAANLLSTVSERLDEMADFLTSNTDTGRIGLEDTQSLNDKVISQVRALSKEAHDATNLSVLQSLLTSRLESVAQQVYEYRERVETRLTEQSSRSEAMRSRVADLEREAQELHSKLDQEKNGARLDALTGIANRKSFDERLEREFLAQSNTRAPAALLIWDIDNFKALNDTYGHRAGDRVLQTVAQSLRAMVRSRDFVARIGGEEFIVLLNGLPYEAAIQKAQELRAAIAELRFHFRGTPVRVTASCGITELRDRDAPGAVFDRADSALYQAKSAGKNLCIAA